MSGVHNPYYNRGIVYDLSMFFGREDDVQCVLEAIKKGQCCSIVGSRHVGKSSLLKFLADPVVHQRYGYTMQDHIFILIDWREFLNNSSNDFFRIVHEKIMAQCSYLPDLQPSGKNDQERFKRLLEDVKRKKFRLVLLMDVFDAVTRNPEFSPGFFSYLRWLAGINELVTFVTATIKPLHEVCHSNEVANSPFFNIFFERVLGPLSQDETRQLITDPAQWAGCPFTEKEVEWIIGAAGRHPFFTQVACCLLFGAKTLSNDGNVSLKAVEAQLYRELIPHFDQTWLDFDEEQKGYFKFEISQNGYVGQRFTELSSSHLFCQRVRELSIESSSDISEEDVKQVLRKLRDNEYLEKCKLSKMHYILIRARKNNSSSSMKYGLLVHDFLQTGFERLKPLSQYSDAAVDWRLYNILWYRYFKYQISNEQVAARLSLSNRQYYREKKKAISVLWRELLHMEAESLNNENGHDS